MSSSLEILALIAGSVILAGLAAASPGPAESGPQPPVQLRCEYLVNPMGMDVREPRFAWVLEHENRAEAQTAYQVLVSTDRAAEKGDLWDSAKVASADSTQVAYKGAALRSGTTYYWKVRWWDKEGRESPWSAVSRFDTGLLDAADWKGAWIGGGNELRKEFALGAAVKRARAYVCGLGYHELRVNGRKAGRAVLDPGWTTYDKRSLYVTYDVTDMLRAGQNALGVILGQGWFKSRALLLQLNIERWKAPRAA
jgi:alpha-L-rhamnosidase